jgi:hypothetical protein
VIINIATMWVIDIWGVIVTSMAIIDIIIDINIGILEVRWNFNMMIK